MINIAFALNVAPFLATVDINPIARRVSNDKLALAMEATPDVPTYTEYPPIPIKVYPLGTLVKSYDRSNSDLTEKIKWALPSQANLEMFHGSASIALVQGQITSYDVLAQLKSATDWTTVIAVLPNLAASVPAFVNYASGTFYAYSINGSFNNVEISYIAVGF